MRLAAAVAAAVAVGGDIAVGLAAQSLFEGHSLLLAWFGEPGALVVVSMSRAIGTWACVCHSGPAVETGIEMLSVNSFAAVVGCSFLFFRGYEIATRCSSSCSGFASARVDAV